MAVCHLLTTAPRWLTAETKVSYVWYELTISKIATTLMTHCRDEGLVWYKLTIRKIATAPQWLKAETKVLYVGYELTIRKIATTLMTHCRDEGVLWYELTIHKIGTAHLWIIAGPFHIPWPSLTSGHGHGHGHDLGQCIAGKEVSYDTNWPCKIATDSS